MSDTKAVQAMAIRQSIGVERLGEIMWKSGYWQDTRSQAQAIVKILAGAELDFGPITSMNGVYIIEGRTSLAANLIGSAIQRSERYRYRVVEHDDAHCVIDFFEIVDGKREKLGTSSFSLEDAQKAELLGKRGRMWEKYPRNMVFSRALSNGAKWYTPDVFNGPVYTPDELGAEVDIEGNVIDIQPYVPTDVREVEDQPRKPANDPIRLIQSADDRIWKRWAEIRKEALDLGVPFEEIKLPIAREPLVNAGVVLAARIQERKGQLALEETRREEGAAAHAQPTAWERNRELMLLAYQQKLKLRELPSNTPLEEVDKRNGEIEMLLEQIAAKA
jgi:hypothetical protein